MAQNYFWPPSGGSAGSNPSVGTNGTTAPGSSTEVAGVNPSGNLQPLQTDGSGNLNVNIASGLANPLPVSDATTHSELTTINNTLGSPFQAGGAISNTAFGISGSLPAGSNNIGSITNITGTISLPTGAATNSELVTINTTLGSPFQAGGSIGNTAFGISGSLPAGTNALGSVSVSNFPATQPISGTVTANQGTAGASAWLTSDATTHSELTTINTTLGSPFQAGGSIANTAFAQATPTPLTIHQAAITVGTTAVRLTVSGSAPASTRVTLVATPDAASTAKFYIGSSTVTSTGSTRGAQIQATQIFTANNDAGDYWIVSDTAGQTVELMEQY